MFNKEFLSIVKTEDAEQMKSLAQGVLAKMRTENLTLQEALGVDSDLLEEIYTLAYENYNQGKYKEAQSLFYLLFSISPLEYKYTLGLASCMHQLKDYKHASFGFFSAWHLEKNNPIPTYYVADCLLKMSDLEGAKEFLKKTVEIINSNGGHETLKERCILTLKSLNAKN